MTYISVGLRILLSIAFLGAGGAKLAGVDMMVMTFDQIGWGQGFRFPVSYTHLTLPTNREV